MTDAHPRAPDSGGPFIPRTLMPVNVGHSTVNLYPIIDPSMATHERAHAYHINKTALSSQNIDLRVQLDALGHQLNLSATVEGVTNDWLRYFYDRWCDFQAVQILSFHNFKGDEVTDSTDAADQLLPFPDQQSHVIVLETAAINNCPAPPHPVVVNRRGCCDH